MPNANTAAQEDIRSHAARPLGTAAANILDQINASNREDIRDAYDALVALLKADTDTATRLLLTIADRNDVMRESGLLARNANYAEADRIIMEYRMRLNKAGGK